jgi:type IV pilus assembly protein PilN
MAKNFKDINLLLAYERGIKKKDTTLSVYFLVFILEICIFALIASIYLTRIMTTNNDIKRLNDEIRIKQQEMVEAQKLVEKKTLYTQKEALLEYVSKDHIKYLEILDKLEALAPSNLRFESLNLSTEKVTCTVRADKLETVTQFVYNLQTSNYFTNINFSSVTGDENSKTSTISADIARK